jgi:hypothetical protein
MNHENFVTNINNEDLFHQIIRSNLIYIRFIKNFFLNKLLFNKLIKNC